MKRPALQRVPPLRLGFTNVVQQGRPSQPKVIGMERYIVEHLQCVVKIILMFPPVARLHHVERHQFGQNNRQKTRPMQFYKPTAGRRGSDNLIEFLHDTLTTDNLDALRITAQCIEGFIVDEKS